MLKINPDKDEIPPTVTSRIREVLARNIIARNHGLSPQGFAEAVRTLLSSLVAARLLEEAGVFRYGSVEEQTRLKGLAEGLSSFFPDSTLGETPGITPGMDSTGVRTWPYVSPCKSLSIDPQVTRSLISLTNQKKFYDEWADAGSDSHERTLLAFLRSSAQLSHDGRMVIGEQYPYLASQGVPLLPARFLETVANDLLLPRLAGKTPKNAGMQFVDPACRTGRILLAMYQVLTGWHLSWYTKHLVPLLEEGRDPASRKVQGLLPVFVSMDNYTGNKRFGTLPLPVYQLPDGQWDLTRDEKVRILGDSLYGIDSDPAAVEVTRLSILSYILHTAGHRYSDGSIHGLLMGMLSRNIRCGNILIGKDYEEQPTLVPGSGKKCQVKRFFIGDNYPGVASAGGFGVVFSMFPAQLPFPGKDLQDYLFRHFRSGKPDDATPYYLESGLMLTRPGGVLCGIVNGDWQRSHDGALFRGWLAGHQIESVIRLGNHPTFAGMRDPVLITITRHPPDHPVRVGDAIEHGKEGPGSIPFCTFRSMDPKSLSSNPWMFKGSSPAEIREKIDSAGTPLARYILGDYMLSENEYLQKFVISRQEYKDIQRKDPVMGTFIHPYVTPGEVRRYCPPGYLWYIVRIPPGTTCTMAGAVHCIQEWFCDHHQTVAAILRKRHSKLPGNNAENGCWWEWPWPTTPLFMKGPVVLTRATGATGGPEWMIASNGVYPGSGVLAIPCNDPALPGILNSNLAKFYILSSARKKGMHGYHLSHLLRFPVPIPETEDSDDDASFKNLARLVKKRCLLSQLCDTAEYDNAALSIGERVQGCDKEIDLLVYQLYGLSSADIGGIEDWLQRESSST